MTLFNNTHFPLQFNFNCFVRSKPAEFQTHYGQQNLCPIYRLMHFNGIIACLDQQHWLLVIHTTHSMRNRIVLSVLFRFTHTYDQYSTKLLFINALTIQNTRRLYFRFGHRYTCMIIHGW